MCVYVNESAILQFKRLPNQKSKQKQTQQATGKRQSPTSHFPADSTPLTCFLLLLSPFFTPFLPPIQPNLLLTPPSCANFSFIISKMLLIISLFYSKKKSLIFVVLAIYLFALTDHIITCCVSVTL